MPRIAVIAVCLAAACAPAARAAAVEVDPSACVVRPGQIIQLGSPVFSVLTELYVDRSSPVRKGEIVARLNSSIEEAQLALDQFRAASTTAIETARAQLQYEERELARRQRLAGNMFSKANEIDEMTTRAEQTRIAIRKAEDDRRQAALEAERSRRQLDLRAIRSPTDGVVTEIKLMPGEFVFETTPIMTIAQINPLKVDLVVPARYYGALRAGMMVSVNLLTPLNLSTPARIDAIDPLIDVGSDTFRVRLTLPNPDGRIPAGIRCSARFDLPAGN